MLLYQSFTTAVEKGLSIGLLCGVEIIWLGVACPSVIAGWLLDPIGTVSTLVGMDVVRLMASVGTWFVPVGTIIELENSQLLADTN